MFDTWWNLATMMVFLFEIMIVLLMMLAIFGYLAADRRPELLDKIYNYLFEIIDDYKDD